VRSLKQLVHENPSARQERVQDFSYKALQTLQHFSQNDRDVRFPVEGPVLDTIGNSSQPAIDWHWRGSTVRLITLHTYGPFPCLAVIGKVMYVDSTDSNIER
jgi:hypothetical protein